MQAHNNTIRHRIGPVMSEHAGRYPTATHYGNRVDAIDVWCGQNNLVPEFDTAEGCGSALSITAHDYHGNPVPLRCYPA